MDSGALLDVVGATFVLAAKIAAPALISALVVGFIISLFQAVTQINDATLNFLPKLAAVGVALYVSWSWMTQELIAYTVQIGHLLERVPR
jgi:flagellar biosynthesis protein FliQ